MATDGHIEIDTRINSERVGPDLEALSEKIKTAGEGLKTAGENMSTYISLPLTALGGAAMKVSADMDAAQGKIQAQLGITKERAEELNNVARDVWKNGFGESVEEAAQAVSRVSQNMKGLNDKELKEMTEAAFTLQEAFDYDVNESTRAAKALMDNFGIAGDKAFDLITVGAQKGGDYSGELMDTISEYSTYFSAMGMSAEEMFNIFIQGTKNGAWNLDKVGDAIKEFNIRAKDGSKSTAAGFSAIGFKADEMAQKIANGGEEGKRAFNATIMALAKMKDPVERNAAGVALFGTQWEDLESKVMTTLHAGTEELGNFDGATKRAGDALQDNFGERMQKVFRQALSDLQPVGDILIKFAEDALPKISNALNSAAQWFGQLSPAMQQTVVVGGMLLAAIGPLLTVIGQISIGVSAVVGWFAPLVAAIAEAGGMMAWLGGIFSAITGPVGLIVMAVIGLVAAFVALWQNNEAFRDKVIEIWEQIKTAFFTAISFIKDSVVIPIMNAIVAFAKVILDKLKAFWAENGAAIMADVTTVWNVILGIIKSVMMVIKAVFQVVWPLISGIVKIAWAVIKAVISVALDIILGIVSVFIKIFSGNWKGAWESIKNTFKNIWESIKAAFRNLNLSQIGKNIIQGLVNGFNSAKGAVINAVRSIAKLIPDGVKSFLHIKSPSRLMRDQVGRWIPEGLAEGIEKNSKVVSKATIKMTYGAIPDIPDLSSQYDKIYPQLKGSSSSTQIKIASADNSGILKVVEKALSRPIQAIIDGKQMTMILAPHIKNSLDNMNTQQNRWEGLIR